MLPQPLNQWKKYYFNLYIIFIPLDTLIKWAHDIYSLDSTINLSDFFG